ncbi:MAG: hypothetical protein O3B01_11350 [Planctomycetota bacterium]|nr:hypothetical protein [Planctomycetota bacterium]
MVDLPLSIEKIIIERRTHVLYVNDIQPANPADVLLSDLFAVYETDADATPEAVKLSRIRMKLPGAPKTLPNPIREMSEKNSLPLTKLVKVKDPGWGYDGTRCHVTFEEVANAGQYQIWVAAQEDGRGAQLMARMSKSGELLQGLRPYTNFYLWVTYTDKGEGNDQRQSKPSNVLPIHLIDAFGQK